jgi:hypothetical protein
MAKIVGEAFLTKVILLSTMNTRLPPDRLVCTDDAARVIGVTAAEFDKLAYKAKIKPRYVFSSGSYWLARDVYSLID